MSIKYKKNMTTNEWVAGVRATFPKLAKDLADSPKSLVGHLERIKGYYFGITDARNEMADASFINWLESFRPKDY